MPPWITQALIRKYTPTGLVRAAEISIVSKYRYLMELHDDMCIVMK